jgi:peptide/nickel transport system substrate-binding protein
VAAPRAGVPGLGVPQFVTSYLVAEALVSVGWNGRPTERLASTWKWSDDRLSLQLTLHPNIKFHDGTPLTAPLARDLLQQVINAPSVSGGSVSFSSVTGIEARGDSDLVLRLSKPEAFLLADLANPTIPHPDPDRAGVGTGPYKRVSEAVDEEDTNTTRLEAFTDYYRSRPFVDRMEVRSYDEQRSVWAALMRGEIDAVHEVNPNAIDFVEAQSTVRTFEFLRPYYLALWFNVRRPVFKDARVRQALSFAIDRKELIDQGLNGRGLPADSPVWPYHWAYTPAARSYSLNRRAAIIQLDAANRPLQSRGNEMQSRLKFVCLTVANDARYEKLALLVQKHLYEIGVEMQIQALPLRELLQRLGKGDFEAFLMERTSGRSLGWTYVTFHSKGSPGGYDAADAVLEGIRSSTTDNEMREGLDKFHHVLYDDPPAIFLAWPKVSRAVSTKYIVPDDPDRPDVMGSIYLWRPAPSPQ